MRFVLLVVAALVGLASLDFNVAEAQGRCPEGMDFTSRGCVPNRGGFRGDFRRDGGNPTFGRCPEGMDLTSRGCVPNRGSFRGGFRRNDGGNPTFGRCPEGMDLTSRGCVPNRR